tara:strand:+ start:1065 stop:1295 length:231 start_codon:yes stop_codon:yes gene_type:complete
MSKSVLNITQETKGSELIVLDREALITVSKLVESIDQQMDCLKALIKSTGIPYYSWEKENSVQVYAEKLKVIKTDE